MYFEGSTNSNTTLKWKSKTIIDNIRINSADLTSQLQYVETLQLALSYLRDFNNLPFCIKCSIQCNHFDETSRHKMS